MNDRTLTLNDEEEDEQNDEDTTLFRVPVDAHGAVFVEAGDEEEAFETARSKADTGNSDLSMSVGESYRERVREADYNEVNWNQPVIGPEVEEAITVEDIPEYPSVGTLRAKRKALGLTQKEVANAMGISPKTVSHYEQGTRDITVQKAQDYAKALREAIV